MKRPTTFHFVTTWSRSTRPLVRGVIHSGREMLPVVLALGLTAGLGFIPADRLTAQTFTVLHSFTATDAPSYTNSDGAIPYARLFLSGSTLYGTASQGGSSGNGTVFKVNTDGTGFSTLYSFTRDGVSDGAGPIAGLVLSGSTLYGTAGNGGISGNGTVFKVNTDGTGFSTLHRFTGGDGAGPSAVILVGDTLYGTSEFGGSSDNGTVFALNTDGTGFTNLHSFTALNNKTNSDGAAPRSVLLLSGNTLFGTAYYGGGSSNGTVFAVNTNGTGFRTLYSFTATSGPFRPNSDGANPNAGLILSVDTLYGTTYEGGSGGNGTVFALNTDGTGFRNLHSFSETPPAGPYINSDGANPVAELILSGRALYGTAELGGSSGNGTLFKINADGTGFASLYSFTAGSGSLPEVTNSDGAVPAAGLILSGNTLYGTAYYGGSSANGTVFSLSLPLPPRLALIRSESNVVLTWPANAVGFTLQSAPEITGTFTNLPAATSPYTNPISGTQQFYRLRQ